MPTPTTTTQPIGATSPTNSHRSRSPTLNSATASRSRPGIIDWQQGALNYARTMARGNVVQAMYADIATPAEAIDEPSEWERYGDGYGRMYTAAKWPVRDETTVGIFGWQFDSGPDRAKHHG